MIPIPQDIVRHSLRTELPFVAVATLVVFAGVAAIVLSHLRSRDPLLLWFGVFASMYSIPLLLGNGLVQFASGADQRPSLRAIDSERADRAAGWKPDYLRGRSSSTTSERS